MVAPSVSDASVQPSVVSERRLGAVGAGNGAVGAGNGAVGAARARSAPARCRLRRCKRRRLGGGRGVGEGAVGD